MSTLLEDKDAIRELFSNYCYHVDRTDPDACAELFAEDGALEGAWGRHEGRRAIKAFMDHVASNEIKFWHLAGNEVISVTGDTATARSYVTAFDATESPPKPFMVGYYEDRLVKIDGRWLLKERIIRHG